MVFLIQNRKCYESEICTILLRLRYAFAWYTFVAIVKISVSGKKPWTIVRGLAKIEVVFCGLFVSHWKVL